MPAWRGLQVDQTFACTAIPAASSHATPIDATLRNPESGNLKSAFPLHKSQGSHAMPTTEPVTSCNLQPAPLPLCRKARGSEDSPSLEPTLTGSHPRSVLPRPPVWSKLARPDGQGGEGRGRREGLCAWPAGRLARPRCRHSNKPFVMQAAVGGPPEETRSGVCEGGRSDVM